MNESTKQQILDTIIRSDGKINVAVIRRDWYLNSDLHRQILSLTDFLQSDVSYQERIFCIQHDITGYLMCPICQERARVFTKGHNTGYAETCGDKSCKAIQSVPKRHSTLMDRYGSLVTEKAKQSARSRVDNLHAGLQRFLDANNVTATSHVESVKLKQRQFRESKKLTAVEYEQSRISYYNTLQEFVNVIGYHGIEITCRCDTCNATTTTNKFTFKHRIDRHVTPCTSCVSLNSSLDAIEHRRRVKLDIKLQKQMAKLKDKERKAEIKRAVKEAQRLERDQQKSIELNISQQGKIRCAICNEYYHILSYSHLRTHNVTPLEYKTLYPEHPMMSESVKAKIVSRSKELEGTRRSEEVKQKISESKIANPKIPWNKGKRMDESVKLRLSEIAKQRYQSGYTHWNEGNTTPQHVKDKISETLKSKQLVMSEESKQKRRETMERLYSEGWIHPSYREDSIRKRVETSFMKYGVENWMQMNVKPSILAKLNDREWLYNEHVTLQKPITTICSDLGLHWKNANIMVKSRLHKFNIPQQYHGHTSFPEKELSQILSGWGIGHESNVRNIIPPKELDIWIPSKKVAIEYCGLIWHSTAFLNNKHYHKEKMEKCEALGIRLITIFEDEWIHNKDLVIGKLANILNVGDTSKVFARKCNLSIVSVEDKRQFFNEYHIQGDGPSSINIGLIHDNVIVACMAFKDTGEGTYVLNRYATATNVVGGFSKLLKAFELSHTPKQIISFADLRWSVGGVYRSTGFTLDKTLPPDYSYIKPNELIRIHKFNFRHKNLAKILDVYDPTLSETENTENNKIYRIYNCGLLRFVKTY